MSKNQPKVNFDLSEYNPDTGEFTKSFLTKVLSFYVKDARFIPGYRNVLTEELFEPVEHNITAHAILTYFDKYGAPPDKPSLLSHLASLSKKDKDTRKYLPEIKKLVRRVFRQPISLASGIVKRKVVDFGKKRKLIEYIYDCVNVLEHGSEEFHGEVQEHWRRYESVGLDQTQRPQYLTTPEDIKIRRAERLSIIECRLKTGLKKLDRNLRGGFGPEFVLVAGPYGGCKTNLLINFAAHFVLSGEVVDFVNFEDGKMEINSRVEECILGVDFDTLDTIPRRIDREMKRIRTKLKGCLRVYEYAPKTVTPTQIRNAIKQEEELSGIKGTVVIVDGGERCLDETHTHKRPDLDEQNTFLQFKGYTMLDRKTWIVTTWTQRQTKRMGAFGGDQVKGSIGKFETAQVGLIVAQDSKQEKRKEVDVIIDKVRLGRQTGQFSYQMLPSGKMVPVRPVMKAGKKE